MAAPQVIESLTEGQLARLTEIRDEWIAIGLRTGPADRSAAESAIAALYRAAGLPTPRVVWCGSPKSLELVAHWIRQLEDVHELATRPGSTDRRALLTAAAEGLRADAPCWRRLGTVGLGAEYAVTPLVFRQVVKQIMAPVALTTSDGERHRDGVLDQDGPTRSVARSAARVCADLAGAKVVQLMKPFTERYAARDRSFVPWGREWSAVHDYFHRVVGIGAREGLIEQCVELARVARVVRMYDRVCLVSDWCNFRRFDERGLLHCTDGPAVAYPDGWELCYWHGAPVDAPWNPPRGAAASDDRSVDASEALRNGRTFETVFAAAAFEDALVARDRDTGWARVCPVARDDSDDRTSQLYFKDGRRAWTVWTSPSRARSSGEHDPRAIARACGDPADDAQVFSFRWLRSKLMRHGPSGVEATFVPGSDDEGRVALQRAWQQMSHVLHREPEQLGSQLWGRLGTNDDPRIRACLEEARVNAVRPWLRPMTASLSSNPCLVRELCEGEALAVLPDAGVVLASHAVTGLHAWSIETGELLRTFGLRDAPVCAAASRDGGVVALTDTKRTTRVRSLVNGQLLAEVCQPGLVGYMAFERESACIAISPDARCIVSGDDADDGDGSVRLWSLEDDTITDLRGHGGNVLAVAVTPDGAHAVSASSDRTLRVWSMDRREPLRTLEGHGRRVTCVAVTPDGAHIVSGSDDRTICVWSINGGLVRTLDAYDEVCSVAVTPDGSRIVSADRSGRIRVWSLGSGRLVRSLEVGHAGTFEWPAWRGFRIVLPDDDRVVSSGGGRIRVWSLERASVSSRKVPRAPRQVPGGPAMAVTKDSHLVSGGDRGIFGVWCLRSGELLRTVNVNARQDERVVLSPDGGHAVVTGSRATGSMVAHVWSLGTGTRLREISCRGGGQNGSVTVTADGSSLVSVGDEIRIFSLGTGELSTVLDVAPLDGWALDSSCRCWSTPDGKYVVAERGSRLHVVSLDTGNIVRTIDHRAYGPACLSSGGRFVAATSSTVRVWSLRSGKVIRKLRTPAVSLAVTPDGEHLVTGVHASVLVWNLRSGEQVGSFRSNCAIAGVGVVDFRTLAAVDEQGQLHVLGYEQPITSAGH